MAKKLYNEPSPLETRVLSKRFELEGSETLDVYLANGGYAAFKKAKEKTRVIVVNADESEPGTCKDRLLMEYDPHQMIEGILIASLVVDAHVGYIYIRGE